MEQKTETKNCQNCKKQFNVDASDFDFYKKMDVPAPTFCPSCRFQRRLMFRNERVFYKRDCGLCGKNVLSVHRPEKDLIVYCPACWYSDNWDDGAIYLDYDEKRPFFEQLHELIKKTPHMAMIQDYASLVNSEYVNHAGGLKNCYLVYNADFDENVHYSTTVINSKDSMDCIMLGESELCYEVVGATAFRAFYSMAVEDCTNVYFSKNLVGCSDCFGCINLKKKKYCFFNEQLSKEEYEKKVAEYKLDTYSGIQRATKDAYAFWQKHPHRYMYGAAQNVNCSGEYVFMSKNALNCYQCRFLEDSRYCQYIALKPGNDLYDLTEWGSGAQRVVDTLTAGEGVDTVKYCNGAWSSNTLNVEYSNYVLSCQNVFGCSNLRNKSFRILNKQYSEEEYFKLREKIIKDMNESPYVDSKGREFKYGEFLPYDLSPYDYNESHANQLWPLAKEEVLEKGWRWTDPKPSAHKITLEIKDVPDSINDVDDSILKEIIGCGECKKAFRVTPPELALLKSWGFPIPRKCPDCRHMDRMKRINLPDLYDRNCDKCGVALQTSYSPDRPEPIYCTKCYQAEVA